MQGCFPIFVPCVHFGASFQQEFDNCDVFVSFHRRMERRTAVARHNIDIHPPIQESHNYFRVWVEFSSSMKNRGEVAAQTYVTVVCPRIDVRASLKKHLN